MGDIQLKDLPARATKSDGANFIDDVMEHTQKTWSNVLSGKATTAEYAEAGAEVVAGVVAAKWGLGKLFASGESSVIEREVGKRAVAETMPATVETGESVGFSSKEAIPDVLRPYLKDTELMKPMDAIGMGEKYKTSLAELMQLPRTMTAEAGDTGASVAERVFGRRAGITGERMTADALTKEAARIETLNPALKDVADWGGKNVVTYDDAALRKAGQDAMFKQVPPLGQLLKATGKVTQADIDAAFEFQKTLPKDAPRRFLGQILEDKGLISAADANAAESAQTGLKKYLGSILDEAMKSGA